MKRLALLFGALLAYAGLALAAINVNTATKEELDALPGIGPVKAQAIVDYRTKNGPFKSIDDLKKVNGIGDATLEKIRKDVSLTGATTMPADAKAPAKPAAAPDTKAATKPAADAKPAAAEKKGAAKPAAADAKKEEPKKADAKKDDKKADAKKEEPKKDEKKADAKKDDKKADAKKADAKKDDKKADAKKDETKKDEEKKK